MISGVPNRAIACWRTSTDSDASKVLLSFHDRMQRLNTFYVFRESPHHDFLHYLIVAVDACAGDKHQLEAALGVGGLSLESIGR